MLATLFHPNDHLALHGLDVVVLIPGRLHLVLTLYVPFFVPVDMMGSPLAPWVITDDLGIELMLLVPQPAIRIIKFMIADGDDVPFFVISGSGCS